MTSVKVKFRPSNHECREGVVYYQIIKSRVIRQLKTDYRLFAYEWNENGETVIICDSNRANKSCFLIYTIFWTLPNDPSFY